MPARDHREFFPVDMENGWERIPGYPDGFARLTLADSLDPANLRGRSTRIIRIEAGTVLPRAVVHDTCEEVFLYQGDLVVGCDENGTGGEVFNAPTFAIRPEQVMHGPFSSRTGCLMFELHYFNDAR
ncbi:MAG: cupin [Paracoccaceae bacterium]